MIASGRIVCGLTHGLVLLFWGVIVHTDPCERYSSDQTDSI
jgi:hypothetical protein